MDLFEDADTGALQLGHNSEYATRYEHSKKAQELATLQDKYGDESSGESTVYSSEDSDAEFVTPQVDAAILKTLEMIRRGDEEIYVRDKQLFDEEEARNAKHARKAANKAKTPKLSLKQFHLNNTLNPADTTPGITPAQEAANLQRESRNAFAAALSDDDDGLLVPRDTTRDDAEQEDDDYRAFIHQSLGKADLTAYFTAEGQSKEDDHFLSKYILERGWIDKKAKTVPKYADIVGQPSHQPQVLEEDSDSEFDKAETYETAYNFRFEDPEGAQIITHARDAVNAQSVRRADDSRKRERDRKKDRQEEEKLARKEELKRLKKLKRDEIGSKLQKLQQIAGVAATDAAKYDTLIAGDYDPSQHSKLMEALFNDSYYADTAADEDGKPVWEDDIDITDILPPQPEEDEAYAPDEGASKVKLTKAERKALKAQRKAEKKAATEDKPVFDEAEFEGAENWTEAERKQKFEKWLDEYYGLEYEDMIGDLPTRFKYATTSSTDPNTAITNETTTSLTPIEILLATDAELNAYQPLKSIAPYRHVPAQRNSKKLKQLKKALSGRKWGEEVEEEQVPVWRKESKRKRTEGDEVQEKKKRKGKSERKREKAAAAAAVQTEA